MIRMVLVLRDQLGLLGSGSLAVAFAAAVFFVVAVRPLEERSLQLDHELESRSRQAAADGPKLVGRRPYTAKLASFYAFFDREERTEEWLAKLYGIATAAGLELRQGEYRVAETRERIKRYQINLPVAGSYSQIRSFLETALAEIPVLSLDQAAFRRRSANDARIEADIVLTLHLLRK